MRLSESEAKVKAETEPTGASETVGPDTAVCSQCGHAGSRARNHCEKCGCFLPSNEAALIHGARRAELNRATPVDLAERDRLIADVIGDKGDDISAVLQKQITDYAAACVIRDLALAHVAAVGVFTRAGKQRAAVNLYFQASGRAERLAAQVGLGRVERQVPSAHDILSAE